jgi:hypothetical protein
MYFIQHCFICSPSDSIVSEDAGIEPRTVSTSELAVRRFKRWARSHHDCCYCFIAGVVIALEKIYLRCHGIDENPSQGLITGVSSTSKNLLPVATTINTNISANFRKNSQ